MKNRDSNKHRRGKITSDKEAPRGIVSEMCSSDDRENRDAHRCNEYLFGLAKKVSGKSFWREQRRIVESFGDIASNPSAVKSAPISENTPARESTPSESQSQESFGEHAALLERLELSKKPINRT